MISKQKCIVYLKYFYNGTVIKCIMYYNYSLIFFLSEGLQLVFFLQTL